jgi:hypothetical protein
MSSASCLWKRAGEHWTYAVDVVIATRVLVSAFTICILMTHRNVAQAAGAEETRVPQETIENFCKHAQGIVRVTTRSLAQELQLPGEAAVDTVREVLQDDLYQDPVQVYHVLCSTAALNAMSLARYLQSLLAADYFTSRVYP